jgi:hypothetical protein
MATGWDYNDDENADGPIRCDATNGGVSPGGQIALIMVGLVLLCVATFFWQRRRMQQKKEEDEKEHAKNPNKGLNEVIHAVPPMERLKDRVQGMGKDGFDNLQTVHLGESSPLPLPKTRPANGYHPAGAGIHDFMGTCTISTISQNPRYKGNAKDTFQDHAIPKYVK